MRSRKFIHMGSMTSICMIRCLFTRSRERKYPTGKAMTRQMTVAMRAKSRLRAKTEPYPLTETRFARVKRPSASVRA